MKENSGDVLGRIKHVLQHDTSASHRDIHRKGLRSVHNSLGYSLRGVLSSAVSVGGGGVILSSQLAHKQISAIIVEVYSSHIGVIQGARASSGGFIVCTTNTISTAVTGFKRRSLESLIVARETLQHLRSRFGCELVIAETNPNGTSGKVKTIHFLECFACIVRIPEPGYLVSNKAVKLRDVNNALNKTISSTPSTVLLLKLHKLQFTKGFENIGEIRLRDTKMDISDIKSVERDLIRRIRFSGIYACLSVLLCFRELCDDGDTEQALSSQLNGLLDGGFLFEFNVADTVCCQ
jgi:hypothetical protein